MCVQTVPTQGPALRIRTRSTASPHHIERESNYFWGVGNAVSLVAKAGTKHTTPVVVELVFGTPVMIVSANYAHSLRPTSESSLLASSEIELYGEVCGFISNLLSSI